jgi:RND family efflux transporter MFP subunit
MLLPAFSSALFRAALGSVCLWAGVAGAQEAAPLIPWSSKLDAGAGVSTLRVQPPAAGAAALVLQGTVVLPAQQSDVVSMPLAGVVQAVLVAPMQTVRAGQAVARIMSPELAQWQREWLLAETQARLAQSKAQRDEQMFADGIVSEHRRNESRAQYEMAALAARERRQALRLAGVSEAALTRAAASDGLSPQLTLVAPVAGTVLEQLAVPGQRLEAGSPVAYLARAGRLAIELQAAREQAQALRVGDTLQVDGCKTPARITALSPQLSSVTQSVQLRAELAGTEDCLRINQFVQLRWQGNAATAGAVSVPAAAVVQQGGHRYVFVRAAQGWRAVAVTLGPGGGSDLLVTAGLRAGDEVAVAGVAAIKGAWLGLGAEGK